MPLIGYARASTDPRFDSLMVSDRALPDLPDDPRLRALPGHITDPRLQQAPWDAADALLHLAAVPGAGMPMAGVTNMPSRNSCLKRAKYGTARAAVPSVLPEASQALIVVCRPRSCALDAYYPPEWVTFAC